jgi:ATP-dependent RNA helicase DeaD
MENFSKLGISGPVLDAIRDEHFERPTEIQEKAIPVILTGEDIVAGAATGSGKTLAFGSGIIKKVRAGAGIQSLVLTPTRELALQVSKSLRKFSKYTRLDILAIYGGVSLGPQVKNLRRADVVVGTPGRILDHIGRGTLDLSKVSILVLDEADRMLDMGFIDDVEAIIQECPKQRQTVLCSATISKDIVRIASRYMHNPVRVSAEAYVDPRKLRQECYDVPDNLKFSLLVHFLNREQAKLVMVFCNTRSGVDFVANNLKSLGIAAQAIHGGFTQARRERTMEKFNSERTQVLVCTDVVARGMDIPGVSHVYNYDIPREPKQYIHRIGRTARAGREGKAITIRTERQKNNLSAILRSFDTGMTLEKTPHIERVQISWKGRPRKGRGYPRAGGRRMPRTSNRNSGFRF